MQVTDALEQLRILEDKFESKDTRVDPKIPLPEHVLGALMYCRDALRLVINRGVIDRSGVTVVATEAIRKIEAILSEERQNG